MILSLCSAGDRVSYLSRIWLNPLRSGAQRLIRNPQAMHAAVLGGLSRQPVQERVLWRLELRQPYRGELLVLTQSMASWEHLVEQAGWVTAPEPQARTLPYDSLLARIVPGGEFSFRLRANPTSSTRTPLKPTAGQTGHLAGPRARGVVVPHSTALAQSDWLLAHLPAWGFTAVQNTDALALALVGREKLTFSREPGRPRVVIQTATYEGRVRISDADLARQSLLHGVGRARAYGCGLITLAPAL